MTMMMMMMTSKSSNLVDYNCHCLLAHSVTIRIRCITGSAVALHCCKAHSEISRKMENSTPCKIVTPENFILKLGTRDYVDKIT